jgi:hypothetical protein
MKADRVPPPRFGSEFSARLRASKEASERGTSWQKIDTAVAIGV